MAPDTHSLDASNPSGEDKLPKVALPVPTGAERREIALLILATIALVFALQWARDFFIPLVFGIFVSYTLNPIVSWLERARIPRVIGVSLVMLALLASAATLATTVYKEAQSIVDELPLVTYKITQAMREVRGGELGSLEKLQHMADELRKAASAEPASLPDQNSGTVNQPVPAVIVKQAEFNLHDWLWAGSLGAASFMGQLIMVLFLVFFALLSGDTFKRKLVKLTGPSLTSKKITVHILDDINMSIQKYMFMLLVTNVLLGLLSWVSLYLIGLDNPGAWAIAIGLLHIIPYFGVVIAAAAVGLAAFLQFESFSLMLLVVAVTIGIASLVGTLVTTWMTGRIAKMNATAVFVALLFGGWLWGVWGMLLCVPIIVVLKVIAERIEGMQSVAELLGD
ncbi:AI-2E family transporter [Allopusillimonas ginsengisoli]|nr:AI-2E family transporter [Allopusillimonas ginsengisoli]